MIRTQGLTRRFGDRMAVEGLSFEVAEGEIVGLLGPNGAGKTTTIRMLAGIIAPSSGRASVNGLDPALQPEQVHEIVGLLTESPGFYERLSAKRNLAYFGGFYAGLDVADRVAKSLDRMGLADRGGDRVGTFSKGMKQRLALARTLLHDPKVLFLDEPTAGLDPEAAKNLRELIVELRDDGRTILLSTHNLAEAEQVCDRMGVFRTQLVALDTPAALREQHAARRVLLRLSDASQDVVRDMRELPFVREVTADLSEPGLLLIRLDDPDRDRPRLVAGVVELGGEILEVREEMRSLEEVYLRLVHGEGQ